MPTLLEVKALAWLDLGEETQKDYETAKKQLIDVLMPIGFTLLDKFTPENYYQESRLPYLAMILGSSFVWQCSKLI